MYVQRRMVGLAGPSPFWTAGPHLPASSIIGRVISGLDQRSGRAAALGIPSAREVPARAEQEKAAADKALAECRGPLDGAVA